MISFVQAQGDRLKGMIAVLSSSEEGQDMIEYALLAALISITAILIIILIGPFIADVFEDVVNGFGQA